MISTSDRELKRNCEATIVPMGDRANLPEGTKFVITHRLGGNFTITCEYGMFRISGKDADALGETVPEIFLQQEISETNSKGPPSEEAIWTQLKSVFDPEIPVNIVDLGLVYSMEISEPKPNLYNVHVSLTLTAPGCGMGPAIAEDVKTRLLSLPRVNDATAEIVWDPPWTQDMISEAGKMELGLI